MFKFAEAMKEAMQLRSKLGKLQKQLKKIRVEGVSGGGMVKVIADGQQKILKIEVSDELWQTGDRKFLENLVLSAVNDALEKSRQAAQEEMKELLGMLPPGFDVGSLLG